MDSNSVVVVQGRTVLGHFVFGLFFGAGFVFGQSFGLWMLHILHLSANG